MKSYSTVMPVFAATAGNILEWYDFTIYAYFASYIARAFFPSNTPDAPLFKAFLAFGVGFVARPLGAVVLGILADRAGRRNVLLLSIWLMGLGTLILALAPTFATIGLFAPSLIIVGRVLQGLSTGGEIGAAASLLVEQADTGRRGTYAAWLQATMALSNVLGAAVAFGVTYHFSAAQVQGFGWRIPFFLGLVIMPIAWLLRLDLAESPIFLSTLETVHEHRWYQFLGELFTAQAAAVVKGYGLAAFWSAATYAIVIFFPVYAARTYHFAAWQVFFATLIANLVLAGSCLVSGPASDRWGINATLVTAATILTLTIYPLFRVLAAAPTFPVLILVQSGCSLIFGQFAGPAPAGLAAFFPPSTRSLGTSVSYNIAAVTLGGFAPAAYLTVAAGIAVIALLLGFLVKRRMPMDR